MNLQQEIEALVQDLAHPGQQVRAAAAYSLIDIGRPAIPALIDVLRLSAQAEARSLAAYALGQLRAAEAEPALIEALELEALDQPVWLITHRAAKALEMLGSPQALEAVRTWHKHKSELAQWWQRPEDTD